MSISNDDNRSSQQIGSDDLYCGPEGGHQSNDDMDESNDEEECRSHADEAELAQNRGEHDPQIHHDQRRRPNDHDDPDRSTSQERLAEKAAKKHTSSPSSSMKDEIYSVSPDKTNIIYATNISPVVTIEQMQTFFGFIGDITDIALYHYEKAPETNFKVCFVEFSQHSSVLMAQHLTNTIFIDRAIFVLPYNKSKIPPDAETAAELGYDDLEYVTKFNPDVMTQVTTGTNGAQVLTTSDQRLTAASLQQYPHLPMNTDPTRIEEIRRTLYIGNLDSAMNPEAVLKFFNDIGEVKYIRVAGDETQPTRFAFVEFTHQASVASAILYNGFVFGTRALKINHSNNPIVKPQPKLEIEDPSKKRLDSRSSRTDISSSHGEGRHHSSRSDRKRDRSRGYYDRRVSPRDQRSRRSRSRDSDAYSRSRRSRSRDQLSRRDRSRDDSSRRRSRSRDSSRRRRSRSRSGDRRSKHKSSRRR